MEKFLQACQKLGVENPRKRVMIVRASLQLHNEETVLYFICGHDFIFNPSDLKFEGIRALFVNADGPLHINIGSDIIRDFNNALNNPNIAASAEGSSFPRVVQPLPGSKAAPYMVQSGTPVTFSAARMQRQGGTRDGGVGNYNLQTKALEATMNSQLGLNYNSFVDIEARKLQEHMKKPMPVLTGPALKALTDIKNDLSEYWGRELQGLGISG